ncbi:GxxExxY protein [Danxiaibacter flavus]|uniref:GxxExxY protein n=2 Tax=Danxiaibacter flavus TaxID=3049108 RepID=A0ABV3Z9S8_9BACT
MENEIATLALDVAFKIHKQYGPGLYESVYEKLFCYEWDKLNMWYLRQHPVPLVHENIRLEIGFRADLILNDLVLIELKSVEKLDNVHFKQVLTYLKLSKLRLGLLINFNSVYLKNGIHRIVNGL